jgi:hypothetical protein
MNLTWCGRAVDNGTAKDMLGESFKRQLLMDGQVGSWEGKGGRCWLMR